MGTLKLNNYMKTLCKTLVFVALMVATAMAIILCAGCNVTRVVTTKSEYTQRGDTTVTIVTRTTETYDAAKK